MQKNHKNLINNAQGLLLKGQHNQNSWLWQHLAFWPQNSLFTEMVCTVRSLTVHVCLVFAAIPHFYTIWRLLWQRSDLSDHEIHDRETKTDFIHQEFQLFSLPAWCTSTWEQGEKKWSEIKSRRKDKVGTRHMQCYWLTEGHQLKGSVWLRQHMAGLRLQAFDILND